MPMKHSGQIDLAEQERPLPPPLSSTPIHDHHRDPAGPGVPPLDVTSKPVLVRNIWDQNSRQKKAWALSVTLQAAVVVWGSHDR